MSLARQRVEPCHQYRAEEQYRPERSKQDADRHQRRIGLGELGYACRGCLVTEPSQGLQADEDRQCPRQFADEILDAVVDPLGAAAGAQLIPFDHVGEERVGQQVRG